MTNDAPKRIWAIPLDVKVVCDGEYHHDDDVGGIEYIRAAIAKAEKESAVAAEREACAQLCDVVSMDHIGDIVRSKGDEIRARADTDALTARDARVRAEALRDAAAVNLRTNAPRLQDGSEHDVGYYHGYQAAINRILALIPADQEGDG